MFSQEAFTEEWLRSTSKRNGGCDPGIMEQCVHALTLLGLLAETKIDFVFKGGTSLLLHLPEVRRLSRDIDIVCGLPAKELDTALANIAKKPPFIGMEEDNRGFRGLPKRRHFMFRFKSVINVEQNVLLDVVEEKEFVHPLTPLPIKTSFLSPVGTPLEVKLPTVEGLLGDKLTAFAPHTVGVPILKPDGTEGDLMQIGKQLFDIATLFDVAQDFSEVAKAYDAVFAQEAGYRGNKHTREEALDDTFKACLALSARKQNVLRNYPDASKLHTGLKSMESHQTDIDYASQHKGRFIIAAKAALLAAHLKSRKDLDFAKIRYTASTEQVSALRVVSMNGTLYPWLDSLKSANLEAYHYWHQAISALQQSITNPE